MRFSPLLEQMIESLRGLPGIGPKSAQRMAFHLLSHGRDNGLRIAKCIEQAMQGIQHCQDCRIFSEEATCEICASKLRDPSLLCVVENAIDVSAIEQTASFKGKYFVLLGRLSPLDGIGPNEIGMDKLKARLLQGEVTEIIIATNPTVEGEATAHYISDIAKQAGIRATRLANGVPIGSELEYIDSSTLAHAFAGRSNL